MRSLALMWALGASVAIHAGTLVATLGGNALPGVASITPRVLEAVLTPVRTSAQGSIVVENHADFPATADTAVALSAAAPSAVSPPKAVRKASTHGVAALAVSAEPLVDKGRLGDYLARQLSEFRAEIDRPVRIENPIIAGYPSIALREGREESVVVWIVVNEMGQAEEVDVIEGSPEFAQAVTVAIYAAKFLPAEQKLEPIRYPIALEFRFRLNEPGAVAQKSEAR